MTTALMFVANASSLTVDEQAVQTRLQSKGLTVTLKTYNTAVPTDMSPYGLLVFCAAAQDKTPGTTTYGVDNYDSYAIPRISIEMNCRPHSKFASGPGGGGSSATTRYVLASGSPIVAGLSITPPGAITWYDTASLSDYFISSANLGAAAVIHVAQGSTATTRVMGATYDKGALLQDGVTAAPARMAAFDLNHFNNAVAEPDVMKIFDNAVTWLLPPPNQPPTGSVASQVVAPGALVTLDGSTITDPEGGALTYSWTPPAGVTLSSNTAQKPTFTAGAAGSSYSFSVVATDPQGATATRTCTVTVLTNGLYTKGREGILDESIKCNSGSLSVALVDTTTSSGYVANLSTDQFLSDVPAAARLAATGLSGRAFTGGVLSASNVAFTTVVASRKGSAMVVYQDTGTDTTSRLVAFINQGTGFPVNTDGSQISVTWDTGPNKIFAI